MSVEKTLEERGGKYGSIKDNANVTQSLMKICENNGKNFHQLTTVHTECLHMIFHKIARMVCGDPFYVDNAHDIGGYAKLLEDYLIELEKENAKEYK